MSLPRIFVSIANYRDRECPPTLRDMFIKARHPERVFAGVLWQVVPGEDDDCVGVPLAWARNVRGLSVHPAEALGVCWARHRIQAELYGGEEFFLQIDSHMRFAEGWDQRLIEMLAACPSERAVLSTYPPAYVPPDTLSPPGYVRILAKAFDKHGLLMFGSRSLALESAPAVPETQPFIAAGTLFGPGRIVDEVPYDPQLYFQGEEITLAARLWTHGWDIYIPGAPVVWHDYTKRADRRRHWNDHTDWYGLSQSSARRVRVLFGMEKATGGPVEFGRYGLGARRSLAAYEAYAGLDFRGRLVDGKATTQPEDAPDAEVMCRRRREVFAGIWQGNGWGNAETRSGSGSTVAATQPLRQALPALLDELGVRILADAGCGDLNWMGEVSAGLRFYFGFDIVPGLVADLQGRFAERRSHVFQQADIVTDVLPHCDAVLCRDCLTHLPPAQAVAALQRFRQSGARYLIATTFRRGRNDWIDIGGWQPMDLTAPPYNLPPPSRTLAEAVDGKMLGVWDLQDLPAA